MIEQVDLQNDESESIAIQSMEQHMERKLDKKNGQKVAKPGKQVNFFDASSDEMLIVDNADDKS